MNQLYLVLIVYLLVKFNGGRVFRLIDDFCEDNDTIHKILTLAFVLFYTVVITLAYYELWGVLMEH